MKKLALVVIPVAMMMIGTACSNKMYEQPTTAGAANPAEYIPFTKALKYRLDQDRADLRKIQFYIDQPLVLRYTTPGTGGSSVKNGMVSYGDLQKVTEHTIPAYTPGVCEKVKGDSLYISFDAPQNSFVFAALYANEHFTLQGTNWYNGVADVTYENKTYKVACDGCGSAGEAKLVIKKSAAGGAANASSGGKVLAGRKLN
ncbi:MAG: hypothetical protein KF744_11840 [Taibaiella sp.]|nr:hypothetical protein [Taibaiella sp.]